MTQPPPYDPNAPTTSSYPPPSTPGYGNAPAASGYGNAPAYTGDGNAAYGGPGGPGGPAAKNTLALTSMILGIAGLVLIWLPILAILGIIAGIVGLILGIIALRRSPVLGGRGQALAGVICSGITIAIFIVSVVVAGALIANS